MKNKIKTAEMWDNRFNRKEYLYGKKANDFLKSNYQHIPQGNVLCIGEGEGRNSVFLAGKGYNVTALDYSLIGLKKTEKLAKENKVDIRLIHTDITYYEFEENYWQGIVSIFCHLDVSNREKVHNRCVRALAHRGVFLLEGYSHKQLKYATGGPKRSDLLFGLKKIRQELSGLSFPVSREITKELYEGTLPKGKSSVIQVIGIKNN